MQKTTKKHLSTLVIFCMICITGSAQAKGGVDNYNLLRQGESYVWMPVVHYQSKNGIYSELRYNYEDLGTVSLFAGKTFTAAKKALDITPMIGFSVGNFSGVSLAANSSLELNDFFLSVETQYSASFKKGISNFFFSWSELGYNISPNIFAGLSFQFTQQDGASDPEPGFMAGFSFKNITVPVYVFNPFQNRRYIVLGINYEYHLKKRK